MDIAFFVLLALVFGGLAVGLVAGADRRRHELRKQRDHEIAAANSLWEVRRREEGGKVFFYLWRYPGVIDEQTDWYVQLGEKDNVKFMEQHSTVLTAVEAECERRNFELTEIRRAAQRELLPGKN